MLKYVYADTQDDITMEKCIDTLKILWSYKYIILLTTISALIFAHLIIGQIRPSWSGSALIRIGQTSLPDSKAPRLAENIADVLVRFNHVSFADGVITRLQKEHLGDADNYQLIKSTLRLKTQLNSELLEIKASAYSTDLVAKTISIAANQLEIEHSRIIQSEISFLQNKIKKIEATIDSEIKSILKIQQNLQDIKNISPKSSLYLSLIESKRKQITLLENYKSDYDLQLSPTRTFSTHLVANIHTNTISIAEDKRDFYYKFSIFFGFTIGLLITLVHDSYKKYRLRKTAL